MRIIIQSYLQASYRLESEPGVWNVVLVVDSGLRAAGRLRNAAKQSLVLHFDDIQIPETGRRMATSDDVRRTLAFAPSLTNLMFTCRAGQSRSAALAFVVAHQRLGPGPAVELLNVRRHVPNAKLIEIAGESMGSNEVEHTFRRWQTENKQYDLSDYYDEIEAEVEALERAGAKPWIVEAIGGD